MDFLQLLVGGIANGCIYGLVALGFVLIYKATEAVNFAHGDIMMLGAFVTLTFVNHEWMGLPFWLGLLLHAHVVLVVSHLFLVHVLGGHVLLGRHELLRHVAVSHG